MLPLLLLLAISLPPADVNGFAARVGQAVAQRRESTQPRGRVLLRVEDPGATGAAEQLLRALQEALRARGFEPASEGEAVIQVHAYLSLRRGQPLALARILAEGQEPVLLFTEFAPNAGARETPAEGPPVAIRTRTLLAPDLPVLDLEADAAGNLFVLHPDQVRVYDLNSAALPLKAEIGLDTGADRLRDPLVRLVARDNPRQLEIYSAAAAVSPAPPLPVEGYALKSFNAAAAIRVPHPWRAVFAPIKPVAGRNYFSTSAVARLAGLAPVSSPLRAHWALLSADGRLLLADADLRLLPGGAAPGLFGGDVASAAVPCAGTLLLAAGSEPSPARDRISVLRVENDRILPYTSLELDGAVRRLKALPAAGDQRRILAVAEKNGTTRVEEIELRCSP